MCVLQCAALRCSVLQRVATCCNVLQFIACCGAAGFHQVCCSGLQRVAVCCGVLLKRQLCIVIHKGIRSRITMATISRLLKFIGLFCRIQSLLLGFFAKETYNFQAPTNRGHPITLFTMHVRYKRAPLSFSTKTLCPQYALRLNSREIGQ